MAQNRCDGLERRVLLHDGKEKFGFGVQQPCPQGTKYPSTSSPDKKSPKTLQAQCKCHLNNRPHRRKWATNGPSLQAVFLGQGPKLGGTGVFIPRTEGTAQFSKKPAYSSVLLPARVVQTLNINVHELGQHVKVKPDQVEKFVKKDDEKVGEIGGDVIYISPDIILPKEWTY